MTSPGNCQEMAKLRVSGTSHATTASPKPSCRTPWRVVDAMVARENAGWTIRLDIPARARTAHKGLFRKDLTRISADSPLMSPLRPNWSRDWTELWFFSFWHATSLMVNTTLSNHLKKWTINQMLLICRIFTLKIQIKKREWQVFLVREFMCKAVL